VKWIWKEPSTEPTR